MAAASVALSAIALFDVNPVVGLSGVFGATIPAGFIYWTLLREMSA